MIDLPDLLFQLNLQGYVVGIELASQPFFLRALIGGLLVGVAAAILGVFVTLRRESFVADAVAHGSLAGIALGLAVGGLELPLALMVAILMALAITYFKRNGQLAPDNTIGVVFPFLFALGIIIISTLPGFQPEITSFLFGNLLAISQLDLFLAGLICLFVVVFVVTKYRDLLYSTLDEQGARVAGIDTVRVDYLYTVLTAVTVVVAVKVVGIVLVTALFVVPAVAARLQAKKFSQMLPFAVMHNITAVVTGLFLAAQFPPGPIVVVVSVLILLLVAGAHRVKILS